MSDILKGLIKQFMPFAQKQIGFEKPPRLFLKHDEENGANPLGKTAFYEPANMSITLYTTGRHPKDILRSLGHELVHHKQNCEGKFDDVGEMGEGYAQTNPHLRQMEVEANRDGSMCLRDFEDTLKRENTIYFEHLQKGDINMSIKDWKNGELKSLLSEAWGFQMDLSKLNEDKKPGDGGAPPWADKSDDDDKDDDGEEVDEGRQPRLSGDSGENSPTQDSRSTRKVSGAVPSRDEDEEGEETVDEQSKTNRDDRGARRSAGGRRLDEEGDEECDEEVVEEDFPGKRDMDQHKSDLSEVRLKEIIAYALNTKG